MWQSIRASVLGRHVHEEAYAALVLSGGYEEAGARAERAIRFCSLIPPMSPQIDFRAAAARANAEIVGRRSSCETQRMGVPVAGD